MTMDTRSAEERLADLEVEVETLRRSRWVGGAFRGAPPRFESRDALPEASALLAYAVLVLRGTPDVVYVCLRNASGAWGWRAVTVS